MTITADFISDASARCATLLSAAGYQFTVTDREEVIRTYVSIRHRRVAARRRRVHRANYIVPANLQTGETALLAKVAAGADLWPHQSRKILSSSNEDGMLNDYGVHHFHLGEGQDSKHTALSAGTEELLFAVVQDDDFYALGIFGHSWTEQSLFDVIQEHWPVLLATYTFRGTHGLAQTYSDDDVKALREARINVIMQRPDGTVHMGLGGGIAADGSSVAVTRSTDQLIEHLEQLQSDLIDKYKKLMAERGVSGRFQIRLEWRNDLAWVVSTPYLAEANISQFLNVPPL